MYITLGNGTNPTVILCSHFQFYFFTYLHINVAVIASLLQYFPKLGSVKKYLIPIYLYIGSRKTYLSMYVLWTVPT